MRTASRLPLWFWAVVTLVTAVVLLFLLFALGSNDGGAGNGDMLP